MNQSGKKLGSLCKRRSSIRIVFLFIGLVLLVPSLALALMIETAPNTLNSGVIDEEYKFQLKASGGTGGLTWSLSGGTALPPGLNIDNSSGLIFGTPTRGGAPDPLPEVKSYTFMIDVVDSAAQPVSRTFVLKILRF